MTAVIACGVFAPYRVAGQHESDQRAVAAAAPRAEGKPFARARLLPFVPPDP